MQSTTPVSKRSRRPRRLVTAVVGVALMTLLLAPGGTASAADDAWWGRDKAAHFAVSTVFGAAGYGVGAALWGERWKAALFGFGVTLAAGGAKELADLAGIGHPSWKDFTWDVVGATTGVGVAFGFDLALRGWPAPGVSVSGQF